MMMENIAVIIGICCVVGVIGFGIYQFIKLEKDKQLEIVKEWLLLAVVEAEKKLGGGTGQIKLRYVYDMFIVKFPSLAKIISFETFSHMVDEVLDEFKKLLNKNDKMKKLEKYLKPKTNGARISPFSIRNIKPKTKYKIPNEDLLRYKDLMKNLSQKEVLSFGLYTNNFIKSLVSKKNTMENIKADMKLKGLKGKEYIHSIGKWNEYIKYLEKEIKES